MRFPYVWSGTTSHRLTVADLAVCRIFLNYGSLFSRDRYLRLLHAPSALANLDQSTVCSTLGCGVNAKVWEMRLG